VKKQPASRSKVRCNGKSYRWKCSWVEDDCDSCGRGYGTFHDAAEPDFHVGEASAEGICNGCGKKLDGLTLMARSVERHAAKAIGAHFEKSLKFMQSLQESSRVGETFTVKLPEGWSQ
jgi:hypothetical protein